MLEAAACHTAWVIRHRGDTPPLGNGAAARPRGGDERAILGMKMKKELESTSASGPASFFFSSTGWFWTSDESKAEQMTEQEVYMNHADRWMGWGGEEAQGSESEHLRLDVTQGLLNLSVSRESTLRKWALYLCYCCSWLWKTSARANV